ncbi:MAG: DUF3880 domain-containing protein, partial [Desulfobacterota bacterium]|nr:DUF3880 domain-containing protein [Thermodesulfobacteriota bacterium]
MSLRIINIGNGKAHKEYSEIPIESSSLPVLRIKTEQGWKTIDSLYYPEKEAKCLTKDATENIILIGCGSGYLVEELLKKSFHNALIITASTVIRDKIVMLLQYNRIDKLNITLICCDHLSDIVLYEIRMFFEAYHERSIISHPGECRAFPHLFNPVQAYIACLENGLKQLKKASLKKILFPIQKKILEPDVQNEFSHRGIHVITTNAFSDSALTPSKAVETLDAIMPDMVFSLNNRGSDRNGFIPDVCRYAGITWATWFLDQPIFIVSDRECRAEQMRFAFCWDQAGIEPCRSFGFTTTLFLPLATNHRIFTLGEGMPDLEGRLVYIGSPSFGNEERYFASLRKKPEAYLLADIFQKQVIATRTLPALHDIVAAMDCEKIERSCFTEQELKRLPAFILYAANLIYRINALKAVADLYPIVFGNGWDGLLPTQITVLPAVDYYREVPAIYRSDCVHLSLTHLQMQRYPNQRIFDAGACGSP